ncbi:putative ARM repeat-containing protein [Lyophyllum shimeji]|uniref:ARM repeat-containing protein n=1 Tax=Lyophyllum shimeji TaxID=47721 RepID=A0A9P3PI73_LYOSH|nr:putative ARM repeat-containing protein [Lyophyllum shimeji]
MRSQHDGDSETIRLPAGSRGVLPDELSYLITAFLPSNPSSDRPKAYLTLSAFCQGARSSSTAQGKERDTNTHDPNTEALAKAFGPSVVNRLAETDENSLLASVTFLTALFQVDWQSAASIFQQDGVLEAIMDSVDLDPSTQLARAVAQLLAQACGHKPCRGVLSQQSIQWLNYASRSSPDTNTRAAATTALIKLSQGSARDNAEVTESLGGAEDTGAVAVGRQDEELAAAMREIVVSGEDQASASDAVEGLAYLSVDPAIKEKLSRDIPFLKRLVTLTPRRKATPSIESADPPTLVFGILLIVSNLSTYRPRLTEEQTQIEKLRQMAKASNANSKPPSASPLDDDGHVRSRVRRLVDAGILDIFASAIRTDTAGVRILCGKALLNIVEDKDNRGKVLQSGGAKVLMQVIKHAMPDSTEKAASATLDPAYLDAIQALAKLAITSSPVQVFGPDEGAMYGAIRPLSLMLQGSSSKLLQRFESLMALTNLSSQSAELATRIGKSDGLLNKVELLLLEDHTLVRRAAMELICNLIAGSDDVFETYGGGKNLATTKSKLQVLIALSDVEDLPTRLAASGAVATLTTAPSACQALVELQSEGRRVFPIIAQLIDPSLALRDDADEGDGKGGHTGTHPGLIHRAIICTRNIFLSVPQSLRNKLSQEAEEVGLLRALMDFVKAQGDKVDGAMLRPALDALKVMMDKT